MTKGEKETEDIPMYEPTNIFSIISIHIGGKHLRRGVGFGSFRDYRRPISFFEAFHVCFLSFPPSFFYFSSFFFPSFTFFPFVFQRSNFFVLLGLHSSLLHFSSFYTVLYVSVHSFMLHFFPPFYSFFLSFCLFFSCLVFFLFLFL